MSDRIRLDLADLKWKPPAAVRDRLREAADQCHRYPSGDYQALREAFADYTGASKGQIVLGNGVDELIDLVTRAYGGRNVVPVPTFSQFEQAAERENHTVCRRNMMEEGSYRYCLADGDYSADLIWICNPNNPTGTEVERETIVEILERTDGVVVVDECYYEFMGETVIDLVDEFDNLIVLRSFSKNFGLAGLRLGAAIAQQETIESIEEIRQPFNVNRLAAVAGRAALDNVDAYEPIWEEVLSVGSDFADRMDNAGVGTFDVNANFVLCEFEDEQQARTIYEHLEANDIITFPGWHEEFSGLPDRFIRFTIGKEPAMKEAARIIEDGLR